MIFHAQPQNAPLSLAAAHSHMYTLNPINFHRMDTQSLWSSIIYAEPRVCVTLFKSQIVTAGTQCLDPAQNPFQSPLSKQRQYQHRINEGFYQLKQTSTYTNSEDLNYKDMDNSQIPSTPNTLSTPKTKAACQTDHIQGMPSSWLTGALNKKKKSLVKTLL